MVRNRKCENGGKPSGYRHHNEKNSNDNRSQRLHSNFNEHCPNRSSGSHSSTSHRHHGKPRGYHHGLSGDGIRMQDGRFNSHHHPVKIVHRITHDSGKSSYYHQLNGQHTCASSTSKKINKTNNNERDVSGQALVLSPKGTNLAQGVGEDSSESPNGPKLNSKQIRSIKKKLKQKINKNKRNLVHQIFKQYM